MTRHVPEIRVKRVGTPAEGKADLYFGKARGMEGDGGSYAKAVRREALQGLG